MQTIQINNPEVEMLIESKYGSDTQSLLSDFVQFIKLSIDDGYPAISKEEARIRVSQAVKELREGKATFLNQEEYDKDMDNFLSLL